MAATAETCRCPALEAGQLTAALLFFLLEEIRNRSIQAAPGSLLSRHEVCAQPCQAWIPIREVRLQPRRDQRPASNPPGHLPGNQELIVTGAGSAALSLLPQAQLPLLAPREGLSPLSQQV